MKCKILSRSDFWTFYAIKPLSQLKPFLKLQMFYKLLLWKFPTSKLLKHNYFSWDSVSYFHMASISYNILGSLKNKNCVFPYIIQISRWRANANIGYASNKFCYKYYHHHCDYYYIMYVNTYHTLKDHLQTTNPNILL